MSAARIVVVEDDRVVARDIAQQIARIGHDVVGTTARGEEALALTLASKASLVLMDVRLEGELDGIEAAEQIREHAEVPVIFLTAYADESTVRRASRAEPFGYLLKPFEDSQLRTAIEMALYKHAADKRLRESERRFAVTLGSIGDAVIATDARGEITFMNAVAESLTGFSQRETVGLPLANVFRIVNEETRLPVEDPATKVLRLGTTVGLANHTLLLSRDGREIAIDDSGAPILDAGGNILGVVLVFRDVTSRRTAEQAELWRRSNQRLELALRGSDISMWEFMIENGDFENARLRGANFWQPYGFQDDIEFATVAKFWHPDDRERVTSAIRAYLAGETEHYAIECRMMRADGEYRTRMVRGVAIRDANGKATNFIGTSVDITERIKLEEALRASEERFRNTFENAPAGLVHTDFENYAVLRVNQTYVDMTGWSREELLGSRGMAIIHPDDRAAGRERFAALASGAVSAYATQLRIYRKDGSLMWVRLTVSVSRDAPGGCPYAIAMVEDISERRRLESELQSAKEAAEASNRAKDEFLANVSHEIRTPMNAILGMTELVLDTALDEGQRRALQTVESAATSLLGIINDLLDFSKIEAGKMELDPSEFSLRALLGDTMRAFAVRAQRKGLVLAWEVAGDIPDLLVGDAGRLRQVFMNLVGNAIKFTPHGEVSLHVAMGARSSREVELHFSVRDTGIGISEHRRDSIFRAFEQEDMSTTRRYGGTGLGLTIASRFVEMMGGAISVESVAGSGSTFRFALRLPWREGAQAAQTPVHARLEPLRFDEPLSSAQPGATTLPLRVLVAEDNPFNSLLLERLLSSRGHAVRVAPDGREALALALSGGFDLLLLDLHMPELDGFQVIQALREHERAAAGSHLFTIALTARSRAEDRARCIAAGMDGFLAKPIRAAALWEAIDRIRAAGGLDPASAREAQTSLIDPEVVLATCGGDAAVLDAIRRGLRAGLPATLDQVERCWRQRDAAGLREAAHSLAGMLAAFSPLAGDVASTLEDLAQRGELSAVAPLIERLHALSPQLLAAVDATTIASLSSARG